MSVFGRLFRVPELGPLLPQIEAWTDNSHLERFDTSAFEGWVWPLTRERAMRVPAVARARHLLAGTIAPLPLRVLRRDNSLIDAQPYWCYGTDGQLGDVTLDQAVAWGLSYQSPYQRMLWTVDDHFFHGESLWLATALSDVDKRPLRAARVPMDHWSVDNEGRVVDLDSRPFPEDRVIYLPGPHEGLLNYASGTIRQASDLEAVAADVARHPIRFELHQTSGTTLNASERAELVTEARAALAKNDGILFTNPAIETKEHKLDSSSELVIAGRNAAALDIARHASIPGAMLDATTEGSSLEYQTTEGRNQQFLDYGVSLYLAAIDARLSMDDIVPAGQHTTFDLTTLTSPAPTPTGPTLED